MSDKYILDENGIAVEEPNLMAWGRWMASSDRNIARVTLGDVLVSTVFLGLDHGWGGPPVLFETMIFGGPHSDYQQRYTTRTEALMGHKRAFDRVRAAQRETETTKREENPC